MSLSEALSFPLLQSSPEGLKEAVRSAEEALESLLEKGVRTFILAYSGGKDSTATATLTLEFLRRKGYPAKPHLLFSDTGLEIPTLWANAMAFMGFLKEKHPPLDVHIVKPEPKNSFWVSLAGKGYPPPGPRFRWCTERLKVGPMEKVIRSLSGEKAVITGVRFGESDIRNGRMRLSCSRGGECGHGVLYESASKVGVLYSAPIAFWRECWVWDYLNFEAPALGYPTRIVQEIYGSRDTRFGCWTCTVVEKDRAMERTVAQPGGEAYLPLLEFRKWLIEVRGAPELRVVKPNGRLGRLTLETRKRILERLKEVEALTGLPVLSEEEERLIKELWENPRYGDTYGEKLP